MRIIIPIRGPEYQKLERDYERFLKDVSSFGENEELIKLIDNDKEYRNIKSITFKTILHSEILGKESKIISDLKDKYPALITNYIKDFLEINIVTIREEKIETYNIVWLDSIIRKLSLLTHLAYATKVDFLHGLIFINKIYFGQTSIVLSNIDFAYEYADEINWPRLDSLNLEKVIKWYSKNNLHTDGNSKNKLHRSINAFSYLFNKVGEKDTSQLFWSMLGIESLLAEGNSNVLSQIKIKSSLILGQPQEYKNKLSKLYDYRSRLIHGDYDFPAKFSGDYEVFEKNYWDNLHFSAAILLALIRELISKDKNEFDFEYKLV